MATETQHNANEVSVQLSSCTEDDVQTVFRTLAGEFDSERESAQLHHASQGQQPDVWIAHFDVARDRGRPEPASLQGTVTAELQGSPQSVARLKQCLLDAFSVQEEQSSSGDQERNTWLRIESRSG